MGLAQALASQRFPRFFLNTIFDKIKSQMEESLLVPFGFAQGWSSRTSNLAETKSQMKETLTGHYSANLSS